MTQINEYGPLVLVEEETTWLAELTLAALSISDVLIPDEAAGGCCWCELDLEALGRVEPAAGTGDETMWPSPWCWPEFECFSRVGNGEQFRLVSFQESTNLGLNWRKL